MKATVLDIAECCGLSTATVDRVLNHRPGVRAVNRQRVMEAAQKLGYLAESGAVALPSKPANLQFLIPIGDNAFMADVAHNIEDYCHRLPLVAACRIFDLGGISPDHLQREIDRIPLDVNGVGVVAVDHPRTRNILRELVESGVRLVTIASDVPAALRSAYIGIDNRLAGRSAALLMGRFLGSRTGHVAVVTGSRSYRGHEEREMGFRSVLGEAFAGLTVTPAVEINDDPDASYDETLKLLRRDEQVVGIYCVGAGSSGVVQAITETRAGNRPIFICHELTRQTRGYLVDGLVDLVIDQNARLIAEQAVIQLLGSIASSAPYLTKKFIEPRLIFRENIPIQ